MFKRYEHVPAHFLKNRHPYFITGAIKQKRKLLSPPLKALLLELLQKHFAEFGWTLNHWVILDNHYHLLAMSNRGNDLPKIIRKVHSISGREIAKQTGCEKPVWWNYWDYCPRSDKDYFIRMNYLLYNPIRHGYVSDLKGYPHSSFSSLLQEVGREELEKQFREFPEYKSYTLTEGFDD